MLPRLRLIQALEHPPVRCLNSHRGSALDIFTQCHEGGGGRLSCVLLGRLQFLAVQPVPDRTLHFSIGGQVHAGGSLVENQQLRRELDVSRQREREAALREEMRQGLAAQRQELIDMVSPFLLCLLITHGFFKQHFRLFF